jgi:hypothetical protein
MLALVRNRRRDQFHRLRLIRGRRTRFLDRTPLPGREAGGRRNHREDQQDRSDSLLYRFHEFLRE